ncbi:MAG: electron transfer flavoprotein subunit beta/FixA family protein [Nitrososphaeria archaeon]|nr:electron transfer flavoprotein subunit beta/FixA family protein [Nitrososphaeria archaeon]
MTLKIIVLIKQVPDIEKVRFDVETGRIDRSSAPAEINPFDLNALEAAAQIKEKVGGYIIALSMGPPQAVSSLKDAMARGADEAILLEDKKFAGADTWATSYTLAGAIKKIGEYDIILCGEKTVDGDTGQVGAEVAEQLSIPHVYYVSKIVDVSDKNIVVVSEMNDASYTIEATYPVLVSVTKDVNKPRLPTLKDKLRAMKSDVKVWHAADLEGIIDLNCVGYFGSPTNVHKVVIPQERFREGKIFRSVNEGLENILNVLVKKRLI